MAASALSSSSRTCGLTILTSLASCDCGGVRVPFAQCASVSAWTPSKSASRCRSSGSLMIVCKISVQGGEEGIILLLLVGVWLIAITCIIAEEAYGVNCREREMWEEQERGKPGVNHDKTCFYCRR